MAGLWCLGLVLYFVMVALFVRWMMRPIPFYEFDGLPSEEMDK